MTKIHIILIIGYLTGLLGFLPGIIFCCALRKMGKRVHGPIMGFSGGLLIAFVCFEMLPKAFEISGLYLCVAGIFAGIFVCAYLEKRVPFITEKNFSKSDDNSLKTGIMLALGFFIHNIPEGMAIGSMLNISTYSGLRMAVIISIHCFPEAVALALPFLMSGFELHKMLGLSFIFALPILIGTIIGAFLGSISPVFISLCLGLAGGVMIYITCGEILPNSKDIWKGRLTPVLATTGFVTGVIITSKI